jgi:hypothetical protein
LAAADEEVERASAGTPLVLALPAPAEDAVAAAEAPVVAETDGANDGTEVTAASAEDEDDGCGKRFASVSTGAD